MVTTPTSAGASSWWYLDDRLEERAVDMELVRGRMEPVHGMEPSGGAPGGTSNRGWTLGADSKQRQARPKAKDV